MITQIGVFGGCFSHSVCVQVLLLIILMPW